MSFLLRWYLRVTGVEQGQAKIDQLEKELDALTIDEAERAVEPLHLAVLPRAVGSDQDMGDPPLGEEGGQGS